MGLRKITGVAILAAALLLVSTLNSQGEHQTEEQASPKQSTYKPTTVFDPILGTLRERTKVPLRLPSFVPFDGDKDSPTYAIIKSARINNYDIELAWLPDCDGGNACHLGSVQAGKEQLPESEGTKGPVVLAHNLHGYFIQSDVGAHPGDSSVHWSEGGFNYAISLKGGREKLLLKMVNSAIVSHTHPRGDGFDRVGVGFELNQGCVALRPHRVDARPLAARY